MKIVYFYQYFSTPKGSWGTRVYEFAKQWVAQGHEVTVVTSVYYKSDIEARGLVSTQFFDGIQVKVLNVKINNKQPFLTRIRTFVAYAILSSWYAIRLPADVVIASSGPITVGVPGLVARILRRRKLVFETRDLWPDGAIELGVIRNPLLKKATWWFEKTCYRAASLIVTLSPGMAEHIQRKYGFADCLSVTNVADNDLFGAPLQSWRAPDWAVGRKLAIYTGNIGPVNNSELLFETARLLQARGRTDLLILLIGDGQQRELLEKKAQEANLEHFRILGLIPKTELVHWVQRAMCCLVPLRGAPIIDTSSPNKLFDSMAAGAPVIQTTNGWIRAFLEAENCGFTVDPNSPEELADMLIQLAEDPELRRITGENARRLARERFDKKILAQTMLAGLERIHGG